MAENYKHIFLSGYVSSEKYTSPIPGGGKPNIPERERVSHSQRLLEQFNIIWEQKSAIEQARQAEQIPTRSGTYLAFTSAANADLVTKSLEDRRKGIRLMNVQEVLISESDKVNRAIVYIPKGKEAHFIKKIEAYQTDKTVKGNPKNQNLVDSIEDVQIALLESFWIGRKELMPDKNSKWCEIWLNISSDQNTSEKEIEEFRSTLSEIGIESKEGELIFPERAVLLIWANRSQLTELMLRSDLLAELRIGQEPAGFWARESRLEQHKWVNDLVQRIEINEDSNIKICLLDSGVNNAHPLLRILIDDENTMSVKPEWGTDDHELKSGHGTLMAGISGYGDLEELLLSEEAVVLDHRLCSVKILPRPNQEPTPNELWGYITSQGIYRAEIQNPNENVIFCLSVTSPEDAHEGRPSSWSAAIDDLAYGNDEDQRLILISAGNLHEENAQNYPNSNFTTTIENPGQSWNALVVGAYTEKFQVNDPNYEDYSLVAQQGELSPFSSTSNVWDKKWPVKPDVVFEGGNLLKSPKGEISGHEDLELLSTSKAIDLRYFNTINATSAAAAKASWFAAKIAHEYPEAWPETIRGLIIHSARWKEKMLEQTEVDHRKTSYKSLIRTFGYGVPNLEAALYSRESAFTFIAQEIIQPFSFKDGIRSKVETNEMHFFELPWPKDLLLDLGETAVSFRITLSYFIEPGPGEIGWQDKYRYASHGLRFDLINIGESAEEFQKRVNKAAREEGENFKSNSGSERWRLGSENRNLGSVHSDIWEGTAAELADCNQIAISPVIGWWRERNHLGKVTNQTRYSLIISLETPLQDVELFSTVKAMIEVPIETEIRAL